MRSVDSKSQNNILLGISFQCGPEADLFFSVSLLFITASRYIILSNLVFEESVYNFDYSTHIYTRSPKG